MNDDYSFEDVIKTSDMKTLTAPLCQRQQYLEHHIDYDFEPCTYPAIFRFHDYWFCGTCYNQIRNVEQIIDLD